MNLKPKLIEGNSYSDNRGIISFANDFKLPNISRFYTIEHLSIDIIRAWQGHEIETKYFFPLKGKFVIAYVKIDNFDNPSDNLMAEYKILDSNKPCVLHIPPGYANGLRALEPNSLIGVFSDMDVDKSVDEKRRYDFHKWFNWFQNFEEEKKID